MYTCSATLDYLCCQLTDSSTHTCLQTYLTTMNIHVPRSQMANTCILAQACLFCDTGQSMPPVLRRQGKHTLARLHCNTGHPCCYLSGSTSKQTDERILSNHGSTSMLPAQRWQCKLTLACWTAPMDYPCCKLSDGK